MLNKKMIIIVLILYIFVLQIAFSQNLTLEEIELIVENININFSLFPTKNTWNNKYHDPLINTNLKREFQELLFEESKLPPNFDGKYRIVEYNFDSSVSHYFFIIDLNTGLIYDRLYRIDTGIKYSIESSLIIINPIESLNFENDPFNYFDDKKILYAKWNGQDFDTLLIINSFPNFW